MAEPIAVGLGQLGLTPQRPDRSSASASRCVAAVAAGAQAWLLAGILVVFGGIFDMFDGALARATGKVSKLGAFMDSTFDRWGEAVVYVGIVWGAVQLGYELHRGPRRRRDGLRVHGQLHPGQVREPRLRARARAWPTSASPRARSGSSSSPSGSSVAGLAGTAGDRRPRA